MAPNDTRSTVSGELLLTAGLFLTTALASQWLQHYMRNQDDDEFSSDDEISQERHNRLRLQRQKIRRQREQQHHSPVRSKKKIWRDDDEEEGDDEGYQEDEDPTLSEHLRPRVGFRDYYKMRRFRDRLSFENLEDAETNNSLENNMTQQFPIQQLNTKNSGRKLHHPHRRRTTCVRRVDSAVDREDEYDYRPKNSNWTHFERHNVDDLENGVVIPGPTSSGDHHHYQAFCSGYAKQYGTGDALQEESTDTGGTGSAADDDSEEPQFVWTEAAHERKTSRSPPRRSSADPTKLQLPAMGQRPTNSVELPAPGRPIRSPTEDSQRTEPTGNMAYQSQQPTVSPEPAGRRKFLRHANSGGLSDSPPDPQLPPQRFLTSANIQEAQMSSLERSVSRQSFVSSSEMSMSPSSNPDLMGSNHKYSDNDLVSESHRSARAQYNAKIMPNKVVMVRHGQSMGNINEELYSTTPDNAMPLTKLGWEQAKKAGQHLKDHVLAPNESVHFIVSPYARTRETWHGMASAWVDPDSPEFASIPNREMRLKAWYSRLLEMGLTWHEDPRIREQDFGNYQDPELIRKAKKDRHQFGTFYYRFPHGESASDVFDRVSTFLDSLWRSFDMNRSRNYVLVTHGISIRVLLARYFRYTIHQFNILSNPRNCEMVVLNHDGLGRLRLQGRCQLLLKEKKTEGDDGNNEKKDKVYEVDNYQFHKRLAILPQKAIRRVDIRISYKDGITIEA